jgi:chromosome partitioning protein
MCAYYDIFLRYTLQTIAITNQKGGSGKTTTAVNLAAALGEHGHRVLLLDLDPQASASAWLGCTNDDRGVLGVFTHNVHLSDLARHTNVPNVDIVPASTWLVGVDKAMAAEVGSETILRQAFAQLEDHWAYVLVDCPPTLGFLSVAALVACQAILVPVETRVMALGGLAALIRTVELVRERLNAHLRVSGIIACRVDLRTNLSRTILVRLRERFGDLVLQHFVRENVRLAEAPSFEQPITVYAPESSGAADYRAVVAELLQRERSGAEYEQTMVAHRR